jgi:hypothetical protein
MFEVLSKVIYPLLSIIKPLFAELMRTNSNAADFFKIGNMHMANDSKAAMLKIKIGYIPKFQKITANTMYIAHDMYCEIFCIVGRTFFV